ncbi:hypothetical protein GPX89_24485 [Nocardia sp. ET3-3]|uniref:RNA polymerase sigma-70 region 2 domain-containing protein n=1 Tax=Nocardia terrae TaxID=2675851 RepID=A0A7K1V1D9_9NOCA|nr:hypothetical protein [Nocardia terrae]
MAVIRGVAGFEGRAALKTWVFRTLVNTAKKRGIAESRTIPFTTLAPEDEEEPSAPRACRTRPAPHCWARSGPGHTERR